MPRLLLVAVAVVVFLSGCGSLDGKFGEELYRAGCAACHGTDLSGGTGPDIGPGSNADIGLFDQQLAGVIRVGPGSMPSYGRRLTKAQIDSLVVYVRRIQRGRGRSDRAGSPFLLPLLRSPLRGSPDHREGRGVKPGWRQRSDPLYLAALGTSP